MIESNIICGRCNSNNRFYEKRGELNKYCRKCVSEICRDRDRSKIGLSRVLYNSMKRNSISRGHSLPTFTKTEFSQWLFSCPNFEYLYKEWVESEYDKNLKPSVDRICDSVGYLFENMQLLTWKENDYKGRASKRKAVIQLTLENTFINEWSSITDASNKLGVSRVGIISCLKGRQKSSGGFKWAYKK